MNILEVPFRNEAELRRIRGAPCSPDITISKKTFIGVIKRADTPASLAKEFCQTKGFTDR